MKHGALKAKFIRLIYLFPKGSYNQERFIGLPLALAIAILGAFLSPASWQNSLLLWWTGVFLWTFLEYLLHRFLLHHQSQNPLFAAVLDRLHRIHHHHPNDETQVCIPLLLNVFFWSFWAGIGFMLGLVFPQALVFAGGLGAMMVWYDMVHYQTHYKEAKNPISLYLKKHHLRHHFKDDSKRFGVTSPFWDVVFRTLPK